MKGTVPRGKPDAIPVHTVAEQFWCEQRIDFKRSTKLKPKVTKAMKEGKRKHQSLKERTHPSLNVKPNTKADWFYLEFHRILTAIERVNTGKQAREVPVFGYLHSLPIKGKIDALEARKKEVRVIETKIRLREKLPKERRLQRDRFQTMLYWRLLADLQRGNFTMRNFLSLWNVQFSSLSKNFLHRFKAKAKRDLFSESLKELMDLTFRKLQDLSLQSDYTIRYFLHDGKRELTTKTFTFQPEKFQEKIRFAAQYWLGHRDPVLPPKEVQWICTSCEYRSVCPRWNKQLSSFI